MIRHVHPACPATLSQVTVPVSSVEAAAAAAGAGPGRGVRAWGGAAVFKRLSSESVVAATGTGPLIICKHRGTASIIPTNHSSSPNYSSLSPGE